ncbi:MAG: TMEM43 family protein [Anaerolineae bacterium]|nr:TMEM43 family protein [Anaerolineae bacterium]
MFRKNNSIPMALLVIVAFMCGPFAFLGGLIGLWMNEDRVNWGEVVSGALALNAQQSAPAAANDGKLVAVTGVVKLAESAFIGDAPYLKPGNYLQLVRVAEMYAWHEKKDYARGSSSPTVTYRGDWTSNIPQSSKFVEAQTRSNPAPAIPAATLAPAQAELGGYIFYPNRDMTFQTGVTLTLSPALLGNGQILMPENAIYVGQGAANSPKVGDMRLRYRVVTPPSIPVTVFGKQAGTAIEPYVHRNQSRFYRLVPGNFDEAKAFLSNEYSTTLWGTRVFGTISIWMGLFFLLLPLSKLTNIFRHIPLLNLLNSFSWVVIALISFVVSLPLALLVMLLSNIF